MASADSPIVGWRLVEYRCHSCHETCLVDHQERRAKYRECLSCHRVPVLDRGEPVDHRLTSLLWAFHAVSETTARTGEAAEVPGATERPEGAPSAACRKRPLAGRPGSRSAAPERSEGATSEPQRRLSDFIVADGGSSE